MGSFCSCLPIHDLEEYRGPNGSTYGHCICLRCLTQQLVHAYSALFRRGEVRSVPSAVGTASLASAALVTDNSVSDTYCSPPRPLPFDDPRCSQLQRDGLISRHDKPSSHLHEESEPLRSNNGSDIESKSRGNKLSGTKVEGGSKLCCPESSLKHQLADFSSLVTYIFSSSEEEDVCPTCLEEYTSENPRIVMQCSHHFHLGCIYEWMERSEACPVCGKVMVFNETT